MLSLAPALALALALSAATAATVDDTTLVRLPGQGAVRGVQLPGSRYWYGIPFAEPPTGKNRWRAPQPRAPWAGVRESEVQPQCMQHSPGWRGASMSEDCLYLNVFAAPPNATEELRPVMVWIHGGGFNGGDAVQGHGLFNGSGLVESQGVVVVSLDYRVNAFGFLGSQHLLRARTVRLLPRLTAHGERGLRPRRFEDVVAALRLLTLLLLLLLLLRS